MPDASSKKGRPLQAADVLPNASPTNVRATSTTRKDDDDDDDDQSVNRSSAIYFTPIRKKWGLNTDEATPDTHAAAAPILPFKKRKLAEPVLPMKCPTPRKLNLGQSTTASATPQATRRSVETPALQPTDEDNPRQKVIKLARRVCLLQRITGKQFLEMSNTAVARKFLVRFVKGQHTAKEGERFFDELHTAAKRSSVTNPENPRSGSGSGALPASAKTK
jgi:hypothetical protein